MNLNIPVVATTPGPQYAQEVNSSLNKIDIHNHTSGQGVQIPSSGLNINANISMNSNGLSNASIIGLVSSSLPATNGAIYRNNDDLYFRDGAGNNVRITQGGVVAVSGAVGFSGLPFGTAGASYDNITQSFIFESATNTPANIDVGSITIREVTASPNGITLSSPAGLGSSYSMTLPSGNPVANSFLMVGPTGTITNNVAPDGTTIQIVGNQLVSVAPTPSGPNYAETAAWNAIDSGVGIRSITSPWVSLTTTGNLVMVGAVSATLSNSGIRNNLSAAAGTEYTGFYATWQTDISTPQRIQPWAYFNPPSPGSDIKLPPSSINTIISVTPGARQFRVKLEPIYQGPAIKSIEAIEIKIFAYELK